MTKGDALKATAEAVPQITAKGAEIASHPAPTPIEQDHIKQALEASQSAMDAIGTVTDIATYTLTILGVFIAILALWGVVAIINAARATAKQIANDRFDDYIESKEFSDFVKSRIDTAVEAKWQENQIGSMEQEVILAGEGVSPFPPPPKEKK
jgi:hypothetical protein